MAPDTLPRSAFWRRESVCRRGGVHVGGWGRRGIRLQYRDTARSGDLSAKRLLSIVFIQAIVNMEAGC